MICDLKLNSEVWTKKGPWPTRATEFLNLNPKNQTKWVYKRTSDSRFQEQPKCRLKSFPFNFKSITIATHNNLRYLFIERGRAMISITNWYNYKDGKEYKTHKQRQYRNSKIIVNQVKEQRWWSYLVGRVLEPPRSEVVLVNSGPRS